MESNRLIAAYNQLKTYQVVRCEMVHERIKMKGKEPIVQKTAAGYECERLGLCSTELRSVRLGCAHASSNYRFEKILEELHGCDPLFKECHTAMNGTILDIYHLDHEKGELEKQLAIRLTEGEKTDDVLAQIKTLVKRHYHLLDELDSLRQKVLRGLESMLHQG